MIHRGGISLKSIYFFYFASLGSFLPFLSILFHDRGISPAKIGTIMMVLPACSLIIPPFWGMLADATASRLLILRIALIGTGISVLALVPHQSFAFALATMIALGLFRSPIMALLDAITHAHLHGRLEQFAKYRLWGSVGFLLASAIFGHLRDTIGETDALMITSVLLGACALVTLGLAPTQHRTENPQHVWRETLGYVRQSSTYLFMGGVAIYYMAHSVFDAYIGLHLKELGYSDSFVGITWSFGVAAEVVLMVFAPRILERFSPGTILCASALAAVFRWGLLSLVTSQAGILAQQPLHALTFGLWYLAAAKWIQSRSPEHLRASLQSIMSSSLGLGMLTGFFVGGWCYDLYGGQILYLTAAGLALLSFTIYLPLRRLESA